MDNQLQLDPTPQRPRYQLVLRRISLIVGLLLVGAGSTLAGFAIFEHKTPMQVVSQVTRVFVPSPEQVFGKSNLLILVEGLDYDYNNLDEEYSSQSRSDVIWAVNLNLQTKQLYELSVPRDMEVDLNGRQAKINEAQSDGGVKEARKVIANFLGIPGFDRYVILRANSAKDMINAIGGVEVNVQNSDPKDKSIMSYDDTWGHLHIHLKPGYQHLNGEQAVGYMRFRHDWCGDPCRIKRQQQVLRALADKLKGDTLNTVMHSGDLITAFRRNVDTNFSQSELVSLVTAFAGLTPKDIHVNQVPYTGDTTLADGGDALVPDQTGKAEMVRTMLLAPPTPIPSPSAYALGTILPGSVRVDVQNGSGVRGAAHRVADLLQKDGFAIASVGDAPNDDYATTEIHEHSKLAFAGAKVRAALPSSQSVQVIGDDDAATAAPPATDVTVVVGRDLAAAVAKPLPISTP